MRDALMIEQRPPSLSSRRMEGAPAALERNYSMNVDRTVRHYAKRPPRRRLRVVGNGGWRWLKLTNFYFSDEYVPLHVHIHTHTCAYSIIYIYMAPSGSSEPSSARVQCAQRESSSTRTRNFH